MSTETVPAGSGWVDLWAAADWSWIVPPISGSATPVFHRYYDEADMRPNYVRHPEAVALARGECPRW